MAEARFDGMVEYMEALAQAACGKQLQDMEPLLKSCLLDIERAPPITLEVGARMLKKLTISKVPQEWHPSVLEVVQKKVQVEAEAFPANNGGSGKKQPQRCNHLCNYFLQTEWDSFKSNGTANKITVVAQRMASLGLVNPTEQSFVHAVAVIYLSSHKGPVEEMMVNGTHALQVLRDLKSLLKGQKGFSHSGVLNYPEDPAELPSHLILKAFGQKKPAPSPLDAQALLFLQHQLPARDTHTSVRGCWGKKSAAQNTAGQMGDMFFQTMSMLKPEMLALLAGCQNKTEPQVQLLQGRKRKSIAATAGAAAALSDEEAEARPCPAEAQPCPASKRLALTAPDNSQSNTPQESQRSSEALPAESKGAQTMGVDGMANSILALVTDNKSKRPEQGPDRENLPKTTGKAKQKAKAKAKCAAAGKSKPVKTQDKKGAKLVKGDFPGTGKQPPVHTDKATIYICPNSSTYRVKLLGEKKDKAFSWKAQNPESAWKLVKDYVKSLK